MIRTRCELLIQRMKASRVSVQQCADDSGIAKRTLIRYRQGEALQPEEEVVRCLAQRLDLDPGELMAAVIAAARLNVENGLLTPSGAPAEEGRTVGGVDCYEESSLRDEVERRVDAAVGKMFSTTAPGQGTLAIAMAPTQNLDERVRKARSGRGPRPLLTLVGGYAGSGKSEFGKALAKITGWAMIDKDVTARPMTEELLRSHGGDPNDRHSELYLERVRPLEYLSTMEAACRSLECNLSTVVTAPFLREMGDETWCSRLIHRCASMGAETAFVWVDCDLPTMHDHLRQRSAARDTWKLANWDEYAATVNVNMRPCVPHIVVDNRCNAATCLADQAAALAEQVGRQGK